MAQTRSRSRISPTSTASSVQARSSSASGIGQPGRGPGRAAGPPGPHRPATPSAPSAPPRPARSVAAPPPAAVRRQSPPAPPGWPGWSVPAKTASAASRCPVTSYGVPSAGQQAWSQVSDHQRDPSTYNASFTSRGGSASTSPVRSGAGRLGLLAVGEEHELVRSVLPGQVAELARAARRRASPAGRSIRATRRDGAARGRRPSPATRDGWKPSWNGIRPSRSGAPRARSRTRLSVGSGPPDEAAATPPRPAQPAAHRTDRPADGARYQRHQEVDSCRQDADPDPPSFRCRRRICGQRDTASQACGQPRLQPPFALHPLRYRGRNHGRARGRPLRNGIRPPRTLVPALDAARRARPRR